MRPHPLGHANRSVCFSLHCTGDWPLQDEWTRLLLWARDHSFHRHMELIIAAENNDGPVDYVDKVPNSEEPYIILDEADQNNFRHLAQIIRDHGVGHASKKRLRATPPAPSRPLRPLYWPELWIGGGVI